MAVTFSGRSSFGTNCDRCGEEIIAPESSGINAQGQVYNFWCCPYCGNEFETLVEPVATPNRDTIE